jgi:hypothetical protein
MTRARMLLVAMVAATGFALSTPAYAAGGGGGMGGGGGGGASGGGGGGGGRAGAGGGGGGALRGSAPSCPSGYIWLRGTCLRVKGGMLPAMRPLCQAEFTDLALRRPSPR